MVAGLSNDSGILLARAIWSQARAHKHNLSAGLPVLMRAPSSAVYRACTAMRPTHSGYPRSSNSLLESSARVLAESVALGDEFDPVTEGVIGKEAVRSRH